MPDRPKRTSTTNDLQFTAQTSDNSRLNYNYELPTTTYQLRTTNMNLYERTSRVRFPSHAQTNMNLYERTSRVRFPSHAQNEQHPLHLSTSTTTNCKLPTTKQLRPTNYELPTTTTKRPTTNANDHDQNDHDRRPRPTSKIQS